MVRIATIQDIPTLNYLFSKKENTLDFPTPDHLRYKLGTYLFNLPNSTIFILSPYSTVFMENVGNHKVVVHIILGTEDRGKAGVALVKDSLKWYSSNYSTTRKIIANVPRDNKKCRVFISLIGFKKEGETNMLGIPMDVYKLEVN